MQKTMPVAKASTTARLHVAQVQTEELIADSRSILTPSQRVEEKLAACAGLNAWVRRADMNHAPRRPR